MKARCWLVPPVPTRSRSDGGISSRSLASRSANAAGVVKSVLPGCEKNSTVRSDQSAGEPVSARLNAAS